MFEVPISQTFGNNAMNRTPVQFLISITIFSATLYMPTISGLTIIPNIKMLEFDKEHIERKVKNNLYPILHS